MCTTDKKQKSLLLRKCMPGSRSRTVADDYARLPAPEPRLARSVNKQYSKWLTQREVSLLPRAAVTGMPASSLDPLNAALRSVLSKNDKSPHLTHSTTKKDLLADIEYARGGSYNTTVLNKFKSKCVITKNPETFQLKKSEEMLQSANNELYSIEAVQLGWRKCDWSVGTGMNNMGNACYLNSNLQALFHVPAFVNWLISDQEHIDQCQESDGLCIICAMRLTLQDSQRQNTNSIHPFLIYNKLRVLSRNLIPGRQEDAHEFLKYLVEAMEKSYLSRFQNHSEFPPKIKETTPLNQILGGYLRSSVRCLECGHVSTTIFEHFQDLPLDIGNATTLEEALEDYFAREKLDDDSYLCESCQKKVPATKQSSLERAPMVLCIQLKRFSTNKSKITKHLQFRQELDLTRYTRRRPSAPLIYRLVALVTHMGPTVNCGHYTAVAQAPNCNFYHFDDSTVRELSYEDVFSTNAYIMMYELKSSPFTHKPNSAVKSQLSVTESNTAVNGVGRTRSGKVYKREMSIYKPNSAVKSQLSVTVSNTEVNGVGRTRSGKVYKREISPDRVDKKVNRTSPALPTSSGNGSFSKNSSTNRKKTTK